MKDFQRFHSKFQIDHFIIGRAGTPWGQYQQCLREIHAREAANREDRKRHESLGALNPEREEIIRTMEDRTREISRFRELAEMLKESIGDVNEERRDELDQDLWMHRLRMKAATDIICHGRPSTETVELMLACPIEMREKLIAELADQDSLKAFALTHDSRPLIETTS